MGSTKEPPQTKPAKKSGWAQSLQVPTVIVAFIGMIGVLFQAPIMEYTRWMMSSNVSEAQEDVGLGKTFIDFLKANETCTRTPGRMVTAPNGVEISAMICDTGDIYLAFYYEELGVEKKIYGGIFLNDTIQSGSEGIVVSNTAPKAPIGSATPGSINLWGAAFAATPPNVAPLPKKRRKLDRIFAQQYLPIVECQWFPSDGTIVRKIVEGNACYIEVIDPNSGHVLEDFQVSCDTPCR